MNIRRAPRQSVHTPKKFCETVELATLQSLASGSGAGYNLALIPNNLPNLAALEDVLEQYAITGIKYFFVPKFTTSYFDADEGIQMPQIFVAENKFNSGAPATEGELLQEDNCRILNANRRWASWVSKPKPYIAQVDLSGNKIQSQGASKALTWLPNTGLSRSIKHLGLRCWVQGNNTASNFSMGIVYAKVYYVLKEQA